MNIFGSKTVYWMWVCALGLSALSQVVSIYTTWGEWGRVLISGAVLALNIGALLLIYQTGKLIDKSTVDAVRRKFNS